MGDATKMRSSFYGDGVKLVSYCPLCESSYSPRSATTIGEKGDSHLLHVECGQCACAIIALVIVTTAGISSVGLVTDLSYIQVLEFASSREVDADDVIAVHGLMEDGPAFWSRIAAAAGPAARKEAARPAAPEPPKPKARGWRIWELK